jgi:'Cold-shock' DNA-binding domain
MAMKKKREKRAKERMIAPTSPMLIGCPTPQMTTPNMELGNIFSTKRQKCESTMEINRETTMSNETKKRGTVKFWNEKGWGFLTPDDGSAEVFAHIRVWASQRPDLA